MSVKFKYAPSYVLMLCRAQRKSQLLPMNSQAPWLCQTRWCRALKTRPPVRKCRPAIIISLAVGQGPKMKLLVEILTPSNLDSCLTLTVKVLAFIFSCVVSWFSAKTF